MAKTQIHRAVQVAALSLSAGLAAGQGTSTSPLAPPANGMRKTDPGLHAFVNATIHPRPGEAFEGTLVIDGGRVVSAGPSVRAPAGARVHDLSGMHVYPGFIDAWVEVQTPGVADDAPGAHWNSAVTPQRSALDGAGLSEKAKEAHRKLGFAAAAIVPEGGIFAGRSAVVSLAARPQDASDDAHDGVYVGRAFHALDFVTLGWGEGYPTSHPGCVALMRQTLSDAAWQATRGGAANALTPLTDEDLPLVFDCALELEMFLAQDVAKEAGRRFAVVGSGMEFKFLDPVAALGVPFVVPLRFPAKPDVSTVGLAEGTELETLLTWEHAPRNPAYLAQRGVDFSITATMLPEGRSFHDELRKAIAHGLTPDVALAALTTRPARLLGVEGELGSIDAGKRASFVVCGGEIFDEDAKVHEVWVDGLRHEVSPMPPADIDGTWNAWVGPRDAPVFTMTLEIEGSEKGKPTVTLLEDWSPDGQGGAGEADPKQKAPKARKVAWSDGKLSFITDDTDDWTGTYVMSAVLAPDGVLRGTGVDPGANAFEWAAEKRPAKDDAEGDEAEGLPKSITGEWTLVLAGRFRLTIDVNKDGAATVSETAADGSTASTEDVKFTFNEDTGDVAVDFDHTPFGMAGRFALSGNLTAGAVFGRGTRSDGQGFEFVALRPDHDPPPLPGYPFGPYAVSGAPSGEPVLLTNATVWTQSGAGVIERGYVLIEDGKIARVGELPEGQSSIPVNRRTATIDLGGAHVSPGLIDAHSHTSMFRLGVNEGAQAVTSEVRIGDSIDPSAINWYRQLAHGVTTVLSLHGSANPIGGQSQTTKIRWGVATPREMFMEGSKPGIKFALGENVKRSNRSGDNNRYPETRMGVETLIRDRFTAAAEYAAAKDARRDLELEALAEILAGERLIHCHSYRQDEILMLCRVAGDFGFKVGSFTHGLEVYKVPEAVREHALGASIFSDWWAYKVEVQDAIPFAGPLQTRAGVLTSYNSDSDELARRMNLEAAKALKYAGRDADGTPLLSPQDALAFVTINPAIQMGVGDRVGSLEVGKDADVVVWTGSPLSSYSNASRVFVDGVERFSVERDAAHRARIVAERQRLVQKLLEAPKQSDEQTKDKKDGEGSDPDAPGESTEGTDAPPRGLLARAAGFGPRDFPEFPAPGECGCAFTVHHVSERGFSN